MDQLLNRTPELRLGGSYDALKVHSWFDKFDWVRRRSRVGSVGEQRVKGALRAEDEAAAVQRGAVPRNDAE